MEKQVVTIKDIILATYKELSQINIPASVGPDALVGISMPLARAMGNLNICVRAIEENEKEPQTDIVEVGAADAVPEESEPISPDAEEANG